MDVNKIITVTNVNNVNETISLYGKNKVDEKTTTWESSFRYLTFVKGSDHAERCDSYKKARRAAIPFSLSNGSKIKLFKFQNGVYCFFCYDSGIDFVDEKLHLSRMPRRSNKSVTF